MPATSKRVRLTGSARPRPKYHRHLGRADAKDNLGVTILIRPKPGSPPLPTLDDWRQIPLRNHKYLTPEEYARIHGAAEADLKAVEAFAKSHGLKIAESHAGRRAVVVEGTVKQMEEAFGVKLQRYEAPLPSARGARLLHASGGGEAPPVQTHVHYGFDGTVSLPANLDGVVTAVIGLDDRRLSVPAGGTGDPLGAIVSQVPTVAGWYNYPNTGAGDQVIGVHAPSPAAYLRSDITSHYFPGLTNPKYQTPPKAWNDVTLTVSGTPFPNNTASVGTITSSTPNATLNALPDSFILELTQDISTSATIAQGATINVYFTADSENGWVTFLNRVLQPQSGTQNEPQPTVLTSSFPLQSDDSTIGDPSTIGTTANAMGTLFASLASMGIQLFSAVGDWGSDNNIDDGGLHVGYPHTDPSVVACGGTVLSNSPRSEVVWSDAFNTTSLFGLGTPASSFGTTGGGVSATFSTAPSYQTAIGVTGAIDSGGTKHTGRGIPDIAAMVGYNGYFVNANPYSYTGTSCVAPLYAGLAAVLRSAFGRALGPLNNLFYQLHSAFNPVTFGNNDSSEPSKDSPYFSASPGNVWNACTGLGSADGTKLMNGIASLLYNPTLYFQVNKGSYGLNEVNITKTYSSPTPLWLVLEGYSPNQAAGVTPTILSLLSGVTVTAGAQQPEIPSQKDTPQRIYFPCTVAFDPTKAKPIPAGIFPQPGNPPTPVEATLVTQELTIGGGQPLPTAQTTLLLDPGDDPYFANFATNGNFWLSQDLRVFTVTPGVNSAPIDGVISLQASSPTKLWDTQAAYTYIQQLLGHLNTKYADGSPGATDPFTLFPDQSNALSGDSSVTPSVPGPSGQTFANYNFAVARVRLDGAPNSNSGANVRVLFRVFAAQTNDTDYQSLTYPSSTDSQGQPLAPQLGFANITIPFFATGNYQPNNDFGVNTDYSTTSINNQPVQIGSSGQAWAYYGCYLNFYPTDNEITTPTTGSNPVAVQTLLPSSHSCVVAQLVYDDAPFPATIVPQGPEWSDNFAQRNLQITSSDNPGPASAHRIPQTFDVRPGPAPGSGQLEDYPDELMISWGDTPVGSVASIYWPALAATDVLALAKKTYSTQQLSAADAHTIQCTVSEGVTLVPIPPGTGQNYAGLLTIDLPSGTHGVKNGQVFTITIRRVTTYRAPPPPPPPPPPPKLAGAASAAGLAGAGSTPAQPPAMLNWRYVVGSFAVRIPVTTAAEMLPTELNTLAIMKWRLSQMSPSNRWVPVLERYIGLIEGRVRGIGHDPNTVKASPYGAPPPGEKQPGKPGTPSGPPQHEPEHAHAHEHTGKVEGLIYDRFGDFEGFLLRDEHGHEHLFRSRESEIEALVRFAWQDRVVISVFADESEPEIPIKVILRRAPQQPLPWNA